jgi:hypothetical protein
LGIEYQEVDFYDVDFDKNEYKIVTSIKIDGKQLKEELWEN